MIRVLPNVHLRGRVYCFRIECEVDPDHFAIWSFEYNADPRVRMPELSDANIRWWVKSVISDMAYFIRNAINERRTIDQAAVI